MFLNRLRLTVFQHQPVRYKCNKFAIGGLSLGAIDGVAEVLLQRLQIAPIPGNFDGMADGCACRPTKNDLASKQICCLIY